MSVAIDVNAVWTLAGRLYWQLYNIIELRSRDNVTKLGNSSIINTAYKLTRTIHLCRAGQQFSVKSPPVAACSLLKSGDKK